MRNIFKQYYVPFCQNEHFSCPFVSRSTGKHSLLHCWSTAWQGRNTEGLEELSEQGQSKASQHWLPDGKSSEE